jgi:hypothetical protein
MKVMIPELKKLSKEEIELLITAPLLVSILIAGADGDIDRKEIDGAIATAKKKVNKKNSMQAYYQSVSEDFEDKLKILLQNYPVDATLRAKKITEELAGLNIIFSKVEGGLATDIYDSLRNLAINIAKSSGGFLGLKSIGEEEAEFVELQMINPPVANSKNG